MTFSQRGVVPIPIVVALAISLFGILGTTYLALQEQDPRNLAADRECYSYYRFVHSRCEERSGFVPGAEPLGAFRRSFARHTVSGRAFYHDLERYFYFKSSNIRPNIKTYYNHFSDPLRECLDALYPLPNTKENQQKISTILRQGFNEELLGNAIMHRVEKDIADIVFDNSADNHPQNLKEFTKMLNL